MTDPILDTIRAVGYVSQLQLVDGMWVSWTQYTTENGRTPEQARDLARTLVQRKLEHDAAREPKDRMYLRGRVVRADWVVEEVVNPPATNPAPQEPQQQGGAA